MHKHIAHICRVLKVKPPKVVESRDTKMFATSTTMAALEANSKTLYINKNFRPASEIDAIFVLAHECRHFWQVENDKIDYNSYKTSKLLTVAQYNRQPEEVDANAFAYAYMLKFYGIAMLFNSFDDELKQLIIKKSINILEEQK